MSRNAFGRLSSANSILMRQARKENEMTTITYIDPESLAIAIRRAGGSAWVESIAGTDAVISNRSIAWVRRLCRRLQWITPCSQ